MTLHMLNEKLAYERILNVRTETILTNRFYGALVTHVEPVLSRKFPTAATNGKKHYFNPDFVNKLTPKMLRFVQRHETEHDARHHSTRRGGRDAMKWNIACDFEIHNDLMEEIRRGADMEVPPKEILGGEIYYDPKYHGMSAEDIYRCRELDEQKAQQEQQKKQEAEKGETDEQDTSDADSDEGNGGDDSDDTSEEAGEQGNDTGSDASDDGSEEKDGDEGTGGDAGDEDSDEDGEGSSGSDEADDEDTGTGSKGSEESEAGQEGKANGKGNGGDTEGDAEGDAEGEGDGDGEAEGEEPESITGDMPGGMGEVLDASDDPTEITNEEIKWDRAVRQAASISKARGDLPGHVTSLIERANRPQRNWREELRTYFDQGSSQIETWNRPNRRFIGAGTILPGSQREGLNTVVFLIDTSASCDDVALSQVAAETQAALDEGIIDKLIVVFGDTQVNRADEYAPGDEIDFTPHGRGGTAMRPLFDWAKENVDNPALIVCFTDLEIETEEALGDAPACPVLWAVHGYPDRVREYIARAPWGAPGIDVGTHFD